MQLDNLVVIVTLLALMVYLWTGMRVGRARYKYGVQAPAITGAPEFERAYRAQMNTLEWLPVFMISMWLFAYELNAMIAAALGVVWIAGRIWYAVGYTQDPAKRGPGFGIQALATMVLLAGALGKAIYSAVSGG